MSRRETPPVAKAILLRVRDEGKLPASVEAFNSIRPPTQKDPRMLRWLVTFDSYPRCHRSVVDSPFNVRVAVAGVEAYTADGATMAARRAIRLSPAPAHPAIPHGVLVQALVLPMVVELTRWPAGLAPVVSFYTPTDRTTGLVMPGPKAANLLKTVNRGRSNVFAGI